MTIPTDFLRIVDNAANQSGMNRSAFIRLALMQKLGVRNLAKAEQEVNTPLLNLTIDEVALREAAIIQLARTTTGFENYDKELREFLIKMEIDKLK